MSRVPAQEPLRPMAFHLHSDKTPIFFGTSESLEVVLEADFSKIARVEFRKDGTVLAEFKAEFDDGVPVPTYEETQPHVVPPHICDMIEKRRAAEDRRFNFLTAILCALHSAAWTRDHTGFIQQVPVHSGEHDIVSRSPGGKLIVEANDHLKGPKPRPLSESAIRDAVTLVQSTLVIHRADGWQLLSWLYIAYYQYSLHQFSSSTVTAWSVIEAVQGLFWGQLLDDAGRHTAINGERRKTLTEGRDYTASVIAQILSLSRHYPDSLFDQLNRVRKSRNAITHDLSDPGAEGAGDAIGLADAMLSKLLGLEVGFPISLSRLGPNEALHPYK
jgi:hypothetical protein